MDVPKAVLTITKTEGAIRQVEAAIRALQCGDFDIAVTLAGAAEDMLDRREQHVWSFMLKSPGWLKHPTLDAGETLTLAREDAAFMIARAASKLEIWSPLMDNFKDWFVANLDTL